MIRAAFARLPQVAIEGRRFTEVGALIEHAWWWRSYGNEQR
ncbi:hypothetical protein [Nocardia grenadensis]